MKMTSGYARHRTLIALLISLIPVNALRVALYRALLGYRIADGARIGILTLIACESFEAGERLFIGRNNKFIGPLKVSMGKGVLIGRFNLFSCGASATDPSKRAMGYARELVVGDDVLVNDRHFFDVYGRVAIGARTWIAGTDSQFWTHGASAMDRDITIGADCYLGSAVRFAPGTAIGDGCVLGIASVVVGRIEGDRQVVGGFPAKVLRPIGAEDNRQFVFEKS